MTAKKSKQSNIAAYFIRAYQSYHLKAQRLHESDEEYAKHIQRLRDIIGRLKKKRDTP